MQSQPQQLCDLSDPPKNRSMIRALSAITDYQPLESSTGFIFHCIEISSTLDVALALVSHRCTSNCRAQTQILQYVVVLVIESRLNDPPNMLVSGFMGPLYHGTTKVSHSQALGRSRKPHRDGDPSCGAHVIPIFHYSLGCLARP